MRTNSASTLLKSICILGTLTVLLFSCKEVKTTANVESPELTEVQILEMAQKAHAQVLVLDAHADIVLPTTSLMYIGADGTSKVSVEKLIKGGVNAIVMSIASDPGSLSIAAEKEARGIADLKLTTTLEQINSHKENVVLATTAAEIKQAHKHGKIAFILGFQNARALEKDIDAIDAFYEEGVRVFALTHLGHNDFADSSRPAYDNESNTYETPRNNGLSELGKKAIERINALGGLLDVTQLSEAASLQALNLSKSPVIASHSNVRSISEVSRNMSDPEIDLIAKNDGVIHIAPFRAYIKDYSDEKLVADIKAARRSFGITDVYSYPFELYWEIDDPKEKMAFLTSISDIIGPVYVSEFVDHIDYVVNRVGINHVGIGSDFNHGAGITGFNEASDALNVTTELVRRGYTTDDIQKIWSGNFLRVLAKAENGAGK